MGNDGNVATVSTIAKRVIPPFADRRLVALLAAEAQVALATAQRALALGIGVIRGHVVRDRLAHASMTLGVSLPYVAESPRPRRKGARATKREAAE